MALQQVLQTTTTASFPAHTFYFNVNSSTHQSNFNKVAADGYRMIDLSVSGTRPNQKYAAVYVKDRNPPAQWVAMHDLNQADYEKAAKGYAVQGLIPTWVSVSGDVAQAVFAGIWESKGECTNEVVVNVTQSELADTVNKYDSQQKALKTFKEYGNPNDSRYAAIFAQCPYAQHYSWWYGSNYDQQKGIISSETTKPFWRPVSVTASGDNQFASIFTDMAYVGRWDAGLSIKPGDIVAQLQQWEKSGLYPISLQAHGTGSSLSYSVVVAEQYPPAKRTWRTSSGAASGLQNQTAITKDLDSLMMNFMKNGSVRNAQLAVGRAGTLNLEQAYTWAEPSRNTTKSTDKFLLASISKAFCSAAIQVLFDRNIITPNTFAYHSLGYDAFNDSRLASITVQQLLDHTAGYDRDVSNIDPVFMAREISFEENGGRKVTSLRDTVNYMVKRNVDFNPGDRYAYSNYGYQLLSLLVASLGGKPSYWDFLKTNVLDPNCLEVQRWPTAASAHIGDAITHESSGLGPPSFDATSSTLTAFVYGGDDMVKEACEGPSSLACSASTLVKFLKNHAAWGNGGRAPGSGRSGSMYGVSTYMFSRPKGIDWAVVFNTRESGTADLDGLVNSINAVLDKQPSK